MIFKKRKKKRTNRLKIDSRGARENKREKRLESSQKFLNFRSS